jgi:putative toxin-antitoxin system antitoxin component (TIGR02293 family)
LERKWSSALLLENGHSEASRLAAFLGLPGAKRMSDLALVESVERGFHPKTVSILAKRIDPSGRLFQVHHVIPKSTYHRRLKKTQVLTREESAKILSLAKVFVEVLRHYHGDSELAAQFLLREHAMLGGRTPVGVAKESTAGADLVLKLLTQAEAGVAV